MRAIGVQWLLEPVSEFLHSKCFPRKIHKRSQVRQAHFFRYFAAHPAQVIDVLDRFESLHDIRTDVTQAKAVESIAAEVCIVADIKETAAKVPFDGKPNSVRVTWHKVLQFIIDCGPIGASAKYATINVLVHLH